MTIVTLIKHIPTDRTEICAIYFLNNADYHREALKEAGKIAKNFGLTEYILGEWKSSEVELKVVVTEEKTSFPSYDRTFWSALGKEIKTQKKLLTK